MYVKVTNTHNLEAAIRRASADLKVPEQATEQSPVEKKKTPLNKRKLLRRICWVLLILLIVLLIGLIAMGIHNQNEVNAINTLTDGRLIAYERMVYDVKKLGLLFQIHDEESYQLAKSSIKFSDELKAQYFISEHYSGKTSDTPVEIEYQDIQYEITENDYVNFLLCIKRTQGSNTRSYTIQAEYVGDTCVYLGILN